jgi:peptidoglycan/LPS O-acetylase OafA/YrhL
LVGHSVFSGLHLLRALAALSIVAIHTVARGAVEKAIPGGNAAIPWGLWLGVPVFFALSGFLMAKLMEDATPGRFMLHRIVRIYPGYWLAVLLAGAISMFITGQPIGFDPVALTLVPSGAIRLPLGVDWTLFFEMFFYAVVTLLCFVPSDAARKVIVAAWALAVVIWHPEAISTKIHQATLWQIPLSALNLPFIAGMVAWWALPIAQRFRVPASVLGLAVTVYWARDLYAGAANIWGYTLVPAALVLLFANVRTPQRPVIFGGNASYGLYLVHVPLLWLFYTLLPFSGLVQVGAVFVCALAAGLAFGAAEHQAYAFLRAKLDGLFEARHATART